MALARMVGCRVVCAYPGLGQSSGSQGLGPWTGPGPGYDAGLWPLRRGRPPQAAAGERDGGSACTKDFVAT